MKDTIDYALNAIDKAIAHYLANNPEPNNIVIRSEPKQYKKSNKKCTARPAYKTQYGKGGCFKKGGRLS